MLGLNAKDAQALLEDVTLANARNTGSSVSEADLWEATAAMHRKNKKIEVRDRALGELKGQFTQLGEDYSDLSAVVLAQREVIDSLVDHLAKQLGADPDVVRKAAYKGLTQRYDAKIGDMLSTGVITKDPRTDPAVRSRPSRDWYVPEL